MNCRGSKRNRVRDGIGIEKESATCLVNIVRRVDESVQIPTGHLKVVRPSASLGSCPIDLAVRVGRDFVHEPGPGVLPLPPRRESSSWRVLQAKCLSKGCNLPTGAAADARVESKRDLVRNVVLVVRIGRELVSLLSAQRKRVHAERVEVAKLIEELEREARSSLVFEDLRNELDALAFENFGHLVNEILRREGVTATTY